MSNVAKECCADTDFRRFQMLSQVYFGVLGFVLSNSSFMSTSFSERFLTPTWFQQRKLTFWWVQMAFGLLCVLRCITRARSKPVPRRRSLSKFCDGQICWKNGPTYLKQNKSSWLVLLGCFAFMLHLSLGDFLRGWAVNPGMPFLSWSVVQICGLIGPAPKMSHWYHYCLGWWPWIWSTGLPAAPRLFRVHCLCGRNGAWGLSKYVTTATSWLVSIWTILISKKIPFNVAWNEVKIKETKPETETCW